MKYTYDTCVVYVRRIYLVATRTFIIPENHLLAAEQNTYTHNIYLLITRGHYSDVICVDMAYFFD